MSAFDDLLKEDDALGGAVSATALGEAFAADAAANPAPQPQLPGNTGSDSAAGGAGGPAATVADDRWGDDFGDFEVGSPSPPATAAGAGASPTKGSDDAESGAGDVFPGGSTQAAPPAGGDWGDFAGGQAPGPVPEGAAAAGGDGGDWGAFGSAQPPLAGSSGAEGDWAAFGSAQPPLGGSGGAEGDWAAFGSAQPPLEGSSGAEGAADKVQPPSTEVRASFRPAHPPAVLQPPPAAAGAAAGAGAEWADFGEFVDAAPPAPQEAQPAEDTQDGFRPFDLGLGDAAAVAAGSTAPAAAAPLPAGPDDSDEFGDFGSWSGPAAAAPPAPLAEAAPPQDAGSWDFDFEGAGSGGRQSPAGTARPSRSPIAAFGLAAPPSAGFGAFAAPAPAPSVAPEDEAGEIGDLRSLARSLASRGHLEEAQRCSAHADATNRLAAAEARKREAVAKDDFEGAIKIRSEIQTLSSELAPEEAVESWRRLARGEGGSGEPVAALDALAERLLQRCQCVDSALDRAALCTAVGAFKEMCPPRGPAAGDALAELPALLVRQRRARQMARSIEAASSSSALRFVQLLLVCLTTLAELVASCAEHLRELASPAFEPEERGAALEAAEFQDFLRGLAVLRRILWRLGLAAELFTPGDREPAAEVAELPSKDAKTLRDLLARLGSSLNDARGVWASTEARLAALQVALSPWQPGEAFEAGAGAAGGAERPSSVPLCALCLLPVRPPFSLDGDASAADGGAASALWRGGLWHVQCANFWCRHGSGAKLLGELGIKDPYAERAA